MSVCVCVCDGVMEGFLMQGGRRGLKRTETGRLLANSEGLRIQVVEH